MDIFDKVHLMTHLRNWIRLQWVLSVNRQPINWLWVMISIFNEHEWRRTSPSYNSNFINRNLLIKMAETAWIQMPACDDDANFGMNEIILVQRPEKRTKTEMILNPRTVSRPRYPISRPMKIFSFWLLTVAVHSPWFTVLEDHQPSVETAISANKNAIEPQAAAPIYKQVVSNIWQRFWPSCCWKG